MPQGGLVELISVERRFAGRLVLDKLSLSIREGETVALFGRNGVGKSTLLRIVCGLGAIDGGERRSRIPLSRIGYAPDRFPKLRVTAGEYLRAMGRARGMEAESLERRIEELMEVFKLPSASGRLRDFSKGMLQKTNLMQALLEEPDLLVLDEPLSGLDGRTREELSGALENLKRRGAAIAFSAHDRELADRIADRTLRLEGGKLEAEERPAGMAEPAGSAGPGRPGRHVSRTIRFTLGDAAAVERLAWEMAAVLGDERELEVWTAIVPDDRADAFLSAVLGLGGSVRSVTEADAEGGAAR